MDKGKFKNLANEERKELIRKMANKVCDKYDKAFRMLAEDEKKERENRI